MIVIALGVLLWRNRAHAAELPKYISSFKVGGFELELREMKEALMETKETVAVLENELAEERVRFNTILTSFDPHAPVAELEETRIALKSLAPGLTDLKPVLAGLESGATPEALYAAAEVLRNRSDISHFDRLVACIERIAGSPSLEGYRLHTVWTLTSAVHKLLIREVRQTARPHLTVDQLQRADEALAVLQRHPQVLRDRPDNPSQGIRGPAKWARDWIARAREKLATPHP